MIFGIIAGLQFKSIQENIEKSNLIQIQSKKNASIVIINQEKAKSENLKNNISTLEKENQSLYSKYSSKQKNGDLKKLNIKYQRSLLLSGMTDVSGNGIIIQMDDSSLPLKDRINSNANWFVIHDKDIIRVINELRKGGAEAISINGERVISTSAQVCAGPTILINGKKYITPFEIKIIGNPQILYDTITNSQIYTELTDYSLPINVKIENNIIINKYVLNKQKGDS